MSFVNLAVKEDWDDVMGQLFMAYSLVMDMGFPDGLPLEDCVNFFWQQQPLYSHIPRSFIMGCLKDYKPISHGIEGFTLEGDKLIVEGVGEVLLFFDLDRVRKPTRVGITRSGFTIYYMGRLKGRKPFVSKPRTELNINELRKRDPILDFLMVNEIMARYGADATWRIRDALEYITENPDLTAEEIEKLGIAHLRYVPHHNIDESSETLKEYEKRTQANGEMWELIADFQPALQEWLRAVSKPPECDILSKGQMKQRYKKEVRLPEVINAHDTDMGNLNKQSYESQIFKSMYRDNTRDFFS